MGGKLCTVYLIGNVGFRVSFKDINEGNDVLIDGKVAESVLLCNGELVL